jgi:AcrR family transcriptional regulator
MVRLSPDVRRDVILDATVGVMRRKGMAATTVRDIAHEMGTSSGLIHHYVESMDILLADAFERAAGEDLEATRVALAKASGPVERLRIFFATYVRAEQDWAFQLWLDAWAEAARRPAVRETSHRLNVAWQQVLATAIREGTAAGIFTCDDPEAAAWRILSLLDGLTLQAVAHEVDIDRASVIRWSAQFAESELDLAPGVLSERPTVSA